VTELKMAIPITQTASFLEDYSSPSLPETVSGVKAWRRFQMLGILWL
jgi:hypothetical protein